MLRKAVVLTAFVGLLSFTASASQYYVDAGIGVGMGFTSIDGKNMTDVFKNNGVDVTELGVQLGVKFGYEIQSGLYGVLEVGGIGHRYSASNNDNDWLQFNSYLIGPGAVFYPIPKVQLAASVGYSFTANSSAAGSSIVWNDGNGFAWNVSGGYEVGLRGANNLLISAKYFGTHNSLRNPKIPMNSGVVGVFLGYVRK
jgi:hypothetical protein